MPKGSRYLVLAACGWLSLANAAENKDDRRQQGHAERQHQGLPLTAPIVKPPAGPKSAQSNHYQCINAYYERDDCSRASAQAAIDQASYAYWQTISGAVIGGGTLMAASLAARWAKAAAKYTKLGAEEARRGAEAAEQGVRCHIVIDDAAIVFGGPEQGNRVTARIRNDGDTPARKVRMIARLQVSTAFKSGNGPDDFAFGPQKTRISPWTAWHEVDIGYLVAAHKEHTFADVVGNFWLTDEELSRDAWLRAGVQIKITFIDVFGNTLSKVEYRQVGDLRPVETGKTYPLTIDFGGGEAEEWPTPERDAHIQMLLVLQNKRISKYQRLWQFLRLA